MDRLGVFEHPGEIAAPGEAKQPAPERQVQPGLDQERRIPGEESFECARRRARLGQWQDMAGADEAAIAVGAALAEAASLDDGHLPAGASEIARACGADNAAADHDHFAGRCHDRMPIMNGSSGSSSSVASAFTYADPRMQGITLPLSILMVPSKMLPTMLS